MGETNMSDSRAESASSAKQASRDESAASVREKSVAVSAAVAAAILGISESHFYALRKTGKLGPMSVKLGRSVRWRRAELDEWVNAGCPPRHRWQAMTKGGAAR